MIRNFFLATIRNISRNKGFTFINITGLAIGLAASLLIMLWVQDELSFERFHRNAGNHLQGRGGPVLFRREISCNCHTSSQRASLEGEDT